AGRRGAARRAHRRERRPRGARARRAPGVAPGAAAGGGRGGARQRVAPREALSERRRAGDRVPRRADRSRAGGAQPRRRGGAARAGLVGARRRARAHRGGALMPTVRRRRRWPWLVAALVVATGGVVAVRKGSGGTRTLDRSLLLSVKRGDLEIA